MFIVTTLNDFSFYLILIANEIKYHQYNIIKLHDDQAVKLDVKIFYLIYFYY